MKKKIILSTMAVMLSLTATAHPIDSVMSAVERNNLTLKALGSDIKAQMLETKSANNLSETSVQYSPFYADGVSGVASSELVVSQDFDFPTIYAARNKASKLKNDELDKRFSLERRNILLDARLLCLDIIHIHKLQAMLDKRMEIANNLLQLYEKRMDNGDATILDLNKVKMERMELNAEAEELKSQLKAAEAQLTAINGNQPVKFAATHYPQVSPLPDDATLISQYLASDAEILVAEAEVKNSQQNINISRQNWLPKLTVGYRRNTNLDEAVNGFLVGAAIPIFSNRHKTKEARAMHESSLLKLEDTRTENTSAAQSIIAELRHTEQAMQAYDTNLMETTLQLLGKAAEAGELSSIDYFREADIINTNMTKYLQLENKYHKTVSQILKNSI